MLGLVDISGQTFTLRTDRSLKWLTSLQDPEGQVAR